MAILVKVWVIFCSSLPNQGCKSDTLVPIMSHEKCHKMGNTRHFFLQNKNCIQNYSIPCQKSRYPSKIKDFRLCIHVRIYNIKEDFYTRLCRDDIQTKGLMIYAYGDDIQP